MEQINEQKLNKLQEDKKSFLLYMYTPKCPACKHFSPLVEMLSYRHSTPIKKLDIFENEDVAVKYGLEGVPFVAIFQDGEYKGGGSGFNYDGLSALMEYLDR